MDRINIFAYEKRVKFTKTQMERFSREIVNIFPGEKADTYVLPRTTSGTATGGLLFNKYNYSKKKDEFEPHRSRYIKKTTRSS